MSKWITSPVNGNAPVNLDLIYTISGQQFSQESIDKIESGKPGFIKKFSLYFFASAAMSEEECAVSWDYDTYNDYVNARTRVVEHLGAQQL